MSRMVHMKTPSVMRTGQSFVISVTYTVPKESVGNDLVFNVVVKIPQFFRATRIGGLRLTNVKAGRQKASLVCRAPGNTGALRMTVFLNETVRGAGKQPQVKNRGSLVQILNVVKGQVSAKKVKGQTRVKIWEKTQDYRERLEKRGINVPKIFKRTP